MESRLKMRISRMFRSSWGSCGTRKLSDVMEKAVFASQNQHPLPLIQPISPKIRPFPSIFTPKPLCSTPSLPASAFTEKINFSDKTKNKKKKKTTKHNNAHKKIKHRDVTPFSYSIKDANFGGNWWYSSDEDDDGDDETETLFSSRSNSSDSSRSRRRRRHSRRRKGCRNGSCEVGVLPLQGKVKDTFAVVKRSSDPYNDFRTSMVEMIVEKQIFAPRELENLLQCFLSLNSCHHHKVIVEVFTEIYDALFSDWL